VRCILYPLVNVDSLRTGKSPLFIDKSTISMAMFNLLQGIRLAISAVTHCIVCLKQKGGTPRNPKCCFTVL
jgi:hypothetical protein